jgi:hypothetical protein
MPLHTTREDKSLLVALMPGWAKVWTAEKTACLSGTGMTGLGEPVEVSHRTEIPRNSTGCITSEEEEIVFIVSGHVFW